MSAATLAARVALADNLRRFWLEQSDLEHGRGAIAEAARAHAKSRHWREQANTLRGLARLEQLEAQGFDRCSQTRGYAVRVACSQCEALVINGHASHERGCPNRVHECKGCYSPVPRAGLYCEDCT